METLEFALGYHVGVFTVSRKKKTVRTLKMACNLQTRTQRQEKHTPKLTAKGMPVSARQARVLPLLRFPKNTTKQEKEKDARQFDRDPYASFPVEQTSSTKPPLSAE